MKKNKTLLSIIIILLITTSLGLTSAFTVSIKPINDTILPFESAKYELTLTNNEPFDQVINLYADATNWILSPQSIMLPANQTKKETLIITPRSGTRLSNYKVPVTFTSTKTGQTITKEVTLSLTLALLTKGYPINIALEVTAEKEVDPRQNYNIRIFLKNRNLRELPLVTVKVLSDLFTEEFNTSLEPLSPYYKDLTFKLDPLTPPGKHELSVIVEVPEEETTAAQFYSSYEIIGYSDLETNREIISESFFKTTQKITIKNNGNKEATQKIGYSVGWLEKIFTSSEPKGTITNKNGEKQLTWEVTLKPEEEKTIIVTTNYRPIIGIIILLILAIIAYFLLRSQIVLYKEVIHKQNSQEVQVRIFVRNRSRKPVNNIKIIDKIPPIGEYQETNHLGSLQPTKVTRSDKKGTIMRWEIDPLEPYEERIISYKFKIKLKVIGKLPLPLVKAKFETINGKQRVTTS